MTCFSFNMSLIQRSKNESAVVAAAYRSGTSIKSLRDNKVKNFSSKKGVVFSAIYAPANAPQWVYDRSALWNGAEAAENRKNSSLAREIRYALPCELPLDTNIELVKVLVEKLIEEHQVVVDANIHLANEKGDQRNIHVHLLMTTRRVDNTGLTNKTRELDVRNSKKVGYWREYFAKITNLFLDMAGVEERVDHRSNKARGINKPAQIHVGAKATAIERRSPGESQRYASVVLRNKRRQAIHEKQQKNQLKDKQNQFEGVVLADAQKPQPMAANNEQVAHSNLTQNIEVFAAKPTAVASQPEIAIVTQNLTKPTHPAVTRKPHIPANQPRYSEGHGKVDGKDIITPVAEFVKEGFRGVRNFFGSVLDDLFGVNPLKARKPKIAPKVTNKVNKPETPRLVTKTTPKPEISSSKQVSTDKVIPVTSHKANNAPGKPIEPLKGFNNSQGNQIVQEPVKLTKPSQNENRVNPSSRVEVEPPLTPAKELVNPEKVLIPEVNSAPPAQAAHSIIPQSGRIEPNSNHVQQEEEQHDDLYDEYLSPVPDFEAGWEETLAAMAEDEEYILTQKQDDHQINDDESTTDTEKPRFPRVR
ncbi:MAG: MobA/MobL family protein [Betaproteobacteria bacterium]|nr:MobA/MobL family protein [Betaproteobacteria bacterium]